MLSPNLHPIFEVQWLGWMYISTSFSAPVYGDYWVVDTDYENYTLIYSCSSLIGLAKVEFAWILSRERTLDDATKNKLFDTLKRYKINTDILEKEDQSGCWITSWCF